MFIIDFIVFLFVLGIVVIVHELGHFVAAKTSGVRVEEFGIGFPPKIWKKKKGETEYSIGAIPFGGFNKIYGMDEDDKEKERDPRSYDSKGIWAKLWICAGGIIMNIVFAVLVFYALMISSGFKASQLLLSSDYRFPFGTQENYPLIAQVADGSPASSAGLKSYDVIVSVNGEKLSTVEQFSNIINNDKGKEVDLKLKDGRDIKITPRVNPPKDEGALGVALREIAYINYSSIGDKIFVGFEQTYNIVDYSLNAMGRIFYNAIKERSFQTLAYSMAGPVGIYAITKITISKGFYDIMNLIAILSIALGLSNLLPIPAMDGAKLAYTTLQGLNKKVFSKRLQLQIESYGAMFLIILAIVIVFKDFIQFKDIIFK